jgi:hypothetical protein
MYDAGAYSYRTTGAAANQYGYGFGYVSNTTNTVTSGGGGGGIAIGGGSSTYYPVTTTTTNNGTCTPVFNTNMRAVIRNSNEVRKLQSFLNKYEGANLPVTGNFLSMTSAAVNRFQVKYSSDILAPIGQTSGTNNFYSYSRAKANAIYCANPMNLGY